MDETAANRLEPIRLAVGAPLCFTLAYLGHLHVAIGVAAAWIATLAVREAVEGRQA